MEFKFLMLVVSQWHLFELPKMFHLQLKKMFLFSTTFKLCGAEMFTEIWQAGNTKGYHCTVDLLFDWFGLVCFANKNKNCHLSYSEFQTNQTGGQWYSDTSPFSIPCDKGQKFDLVFKLASCPRIVPTILPYDNTLSFANMSKSF